MRKASEVRNPLVTSGYYSAYLMRGGQMQGPISRRLAYGHYQTPLQVPLKQGGVSSHVELSKGSCRILKPRKGPQLAEWAEN
jgi:hypothetical protein